MAVRGDGSTGKRIGLVNCDELIGANISPNLLRIKTDNESLNPVFLYYLLTSAQGQSMIEQYITRTAKKTITAQNIKTLPVILPPIKIQKKFDDIFHSFSISHKRQIESVDGLEKLMSLFAAKAFAGELVS